MFTTGTDVVSCSDAGRVMPAACAEMAFAAWMPALRSAASLSAAIVVAASSNLVTTVATLASRTLFCLTFSTALAAEVDLDTASTTFALARTASVFWNCASYSARRVARMSFFSRSRRSCDLASASAAFAKRTCAASSASFAFLPASAAAVASLAATSEASMNVFCSALEAFLSSALRAVSASSVSCAVF